MWVRAARFWVCDVRPYFCTHLEQNCHKIVLKSILERPFSVLEHPFPVLECPFPVLEHLKMLKNC